MKKAILVLSSILVFTVNLHSGITIHVKYNATGLNDGTSWTDAYTSFQSALDAAVSGDQIWVAKGTYKPSYSYGATGSRNYHFRMVEGVAIYGGFAGTEVSLSERNISANVTILSGDIGTEGDNSDNCYHVFYHPDDWVLTSSAVLDGFTIQGGNANPGGSSQHNYGAGMYNKGNSPSITNCTFSSNSADMGGGMFNYFSSPSSILGNCTFSSNWAHAGGGMYNLESSPSLTNCTFTSNSSHYGGGMNNSNSSSPTLNNCIIWGNDATDDGDEFNIAGGTTTLNYSCYQNETGDVWIGSGTFGATNNNITSDPLFVGSSINPTHPYSILGISPCADAGNDTYNSEAYDLRGSGYPRKLNKTTGGVGTIDIGAYEYKLNVDPLPVELSSFAASANGTTVTLHWQTATEANNYGFEIQRTIISDQLSESIWERVGFVNGSGTSNSPKEYSFTDNRLPPGKYSYKLKQIDRDGKFKYSTFVEATVNASPTKFVLDQNYPNPSNPSTTISYAIPIRSHVTLSVFNSLGQKITELLNGDKDSGVYDVIFDATGLASGVYLYRMQAGSFVQTRKLIVVK